MVTFVYAIIEARRKCDLEMEMKMIELSNRLDLGNVNYFSHKIVWMLMGEQDLCRYIGEELRLGVGLLLSILT